jgi:hypothetical protein
MLSGISCFAYRRRHPGRHARRTSCKGTSLGWLEREKHGSGLFNTIRSQPLNRPQQSFMARILGQWRSMAQLDCLA